MKKKKTWKRCEKDTGTHSCANKLKSAKKNLKQIFSRPSRTSWTQWDMIINLIEPGTGLKRDEKSTNRTSRRQIWMKGQSIRHLGWFLKQLPGSNKSQYDSMWQPGSACHSANYRWSYQSEQQEVVPYEIACEFIKLDELILDEHTSFHIRFDCTQWENTEKGLMFLFMIITLPQN